MTDVRDPELGWRGGGETEEESKSRGEAGWGRRPASTNTDRGGEGRGGGRSVVGPKEQPCGVVVRKGEGKGGALAAAAAAGGLLELRR
jgi:hypothetical protein